jgi:hypothetical protein
VVIDRRSHDEATVVVRVVADYFDTAGRPRYHLRFPTITFFEERPDFLHV